ncbi:MAG TPA: hypothetical protein VGM92_07480, partial [Candidatus Kapabacteria bacterium]
MREIGTALLCERLGLTREVFLPIRLHKGNIYRDTPLMLECPYIRQLISEFHCPVLSVRFLRMEAGAMVHPAGDRGGSNSILENFA